MKKTLPLLLILLLLTACTPAPQSDDFVVAATTYPVYWLTTAVVGDTQGVAVEVVITENVSCLHDYTLTMNDMKTLENADLILLSGGGLEDFMADPLSTAGSDTPTVDCSSGLPLLKGDDGTVDPHMWLDPVLACDMVDAIAQGLAAHTQDSVLANQYIANAKTIRDTIMAELTVWQDTLSQLSCRAMITFHDGFAYFAQRFDLDLLKSIEEEEGSEASAQEIGAIIALIQQHNIPAVFTEINGAHATAQTIMRETGVKLFDLTTMMTKGDDGLQSYLDAMEHNVARIAEAFS